MQYHSGWMVISVAVGDDSLCYWGLYSCSVEHLAYVLDNALVILAESLTPPLWPLSLMSTGIVA